MMSTISTVVLGLGVSIQIGLNSLGINPSTVSHNDLPIPVNDLATEAIHESLTAIPTPTIFPTPKLRPIVAAETTEASQQVVAVQVTSPVDLDHWFSTYSQAFGIDENLLKHIAKCESGYNAGSISGPYGGMYQYLASTWSSTRNAMSLDPNPDLRFNAEEAIKTTAWKISVGGIQAWPHCGKSYSQAIN